LDLDEEIEPQPRRRIEKSKSVNTILSEKIIRKFEEKKNNGKNNEDKTQKKKKNRDKDRRKSFEEIQRKTTKAKEKINA